MEVVGEEGALWVEDVPPLPLHGRTEQHVHAAEEEVVGVHKVVVYLRVLTCSHSMYNRGDGPNMYKAIPSHTSL